MGREREERREREREKRSSFSRIGRHVSP